MDKRELLELAENLVKVQSVLRAYAKKLRKAAKAVEAFLDGEATKAEVLSLYSLSETGDDVGCDNHYIAPDTIEPCADIEDVLDAIESAPKRILSLIRGDVTHTAREEEE